MEPGSAYEPGVPGAPPEAFTFFFRPEPAEKRLQFGTAAVHVIRLPA